MPQQINEAQIDACQIVSSILTGSETQFVYTDNDGVVSFRHVRPLSIERCINGETVVRTFDVQRNAPRTFRYTQIAVGTVNKVQVP